jgi:glycosyltransferase involved in cell wall biosynthesis
LYLAPPARPADALAAHSFIAEEIQALASAGVGAVVLSDEFEGEKTFDGVRVVGLARRRSLADVAAWLSFAGRFAPTTWRMTTTATDMADTLHAIRVEQAAAAVIRQEQIDVVHSHFAWPGGLGGLLAARAAGVPLVASLRGMDLLTEEKFGHGLRLDPAYDIALRTLLSRADVVVTATDFMRGRALALGAAAARVTLISKGVDTDRFAPAADRAALQAALGLSAPVVLAAGNLKPIKGFDRLIAALAQVGRPWQLVICGSGPDRGALEARARSLGVAARVRFAGQLPRQMIARYFAAADLFVHPARLEAAGNVVLEALASGCPVVCTDSGGPTEFVRHGCTGLVVDDDIETMAGAIELVLADDVWRAEMGAAARHAIEDHHAMTRMVAELNAVYARASAAAAGTA